MESEKVKEIKECLQQEYPTVKFLDGCIAVIVSPDLLKDCLTLINELEKCSKKWQKLCADEVALNKPLKDRIAELEKKNAKLLDSVETVQSNRCVYKCVLTKEHLTKFAERLKEISCEMYLKEQLHRCIDETLKEFIEC